MEIPKEENAGMRVSDLCCKHGIAATTYNNRNAKYGRMSSSDLKRMKDMETILSQLKGMYTG